MSERVTITEASVVHDFKSGYRVLMLKSRHKDGFSKERQIARITSNEESWQRHFEELLSLWQPGERIYGTAGPRDLKKASRLFREAQLASEYDQAPLAFYENLVARWISALMKAEQRGKKVWLLDIDDPADEAKLSCRGAMPIPPMAAYATKNGRHLLYPPFNTATADPALIRKIHKNPLGLLAY